MSNHQLKSILMPVAMVIGALLCRPLATVEEATNYTLTPILIAAMLFVTFCKVDIRAMRLSTIHIWMLAVQFLGSIAVYHLVEPLLGEIIAEGAMICVLAPIAMAAVVIGGMLGANLETMAAYSLLCNLFIAVFAPFVLHAFGNGECTMMQILQKVAPMLIAPFVAGQMCRLWLPRVSGWVSDNSHLSFYVWLASLTVIVGRTTCFLIDHHEADRIIEVLLGLLALVICVVQFVIGRQIGRRYGDTVAGGQSLGQKNTVLVVWMAQSFLDPISSVAPTAYIVWQNLVNSYQLYRKGKSEADKTAKI
jgi:BASS family bile acid:Na+ symporter